MKSLLSKLIPNCNIKILNKDYNVLTKTHYSTEEDNEASYIKCELTDDKVLVIVPDNNYIYIGSVIKNMKFNRESENIILYNSKKFNKTGSGHQYIKSIEFGDKNKVEGECEYEDYECENEIISLGILTEKNVRADVYAKVISMEDIEI
jgi:hypothetical protein